MHEGHQSALKRIPTSAPRRRSPVGLNCMVACLAWVSRAGPNMSYHGWGGAVQVGRDGPRPPGADPGAMSHTGAAAALAFIVAMAALRVALMAACLSTRGLHTTCLYEHPATVHRPSRPKLVQSPLPPTLMEL
jgi:hypothetical protein